MVSGFANEEGDWDPFDEVESALDEVDSLLVEEPIGVGAPVAAQYGGPQQETDEPEWKGVQKAARSGAP